MGLGPNLPVSPENPNMACGRTTGSYPQLMLARVAPSSASDVTCNGGHSGVYEFSWTGLALAPNNNGATIPPQYNALNGSEQAVILGTGGNEAYFGQVVKACTGDDEAVAAYFAGDPVPNKCGTHRFGPEQNEEQRTLKIPDTVAISKASVAGVLNKIHQFSPTAKIFLIGVPRVARSDGAGCVYPGFWLTQDDAPLFATWEDGLRQAMIDDVDDFNTANPDALATYVDLQRISGQSHTMCAPNWADRWMNPWIVQPGLEYPGLELHNTPTGASVMADAIIDSFHAAGLDTGSQSVNATDPVVSISAPADNLLTKNASVALSYTATDNVAVESCTRANGSTVSLSEGVNTIAVDCHDHAGNHGQASVSVTRDSTAPSITNISPADQTNTTAASVLLSYSATDNLSTPTCTPTSGSVIALAKGKNTITISCTDAAGNSRSASVVVNRGDKPTVALTAPADGSTTTSSTVNVAFTVNGGASIPTGTSCSINGQGTTSASNNSFAVSSGPNTITVLCSNQFGEGAPASVTVTGSPPSEVEITAPADGTNTTASTTNVKYLVNGLQNPPPGTSCQVNGVLSGDTQNNPVALATGTNLITVSCTGAFGTKSAEVTVNRGSTPLATISSPSNGTSTAAQSINVSYRVDGSSTLPAGTACSVGGTASTSTSSNDVELAIGPNTISVVCTNQFGQGPTANVSVTRGVPPVVAITAPASGLNTTQAQINVSWSVNGSTTIPGGTSCSVGGVGSSDTQNNPVALALGSNTISVSCSNAFGSSAPASVQVNRGNVPAVAISAPANASRTVAASVNVVYTVNGADTIPNDTSCTVANAPSSSTSNNNVALALGSNSIAVACSNSFGSSAPASVTVERGNVPQVTISAPANNSNTIANSINVSYKVNGASTLPSGTSCTVGGASSSTPTTNSVDLAFGSNTIVVACSNPFGGSLPASVKVNRGSPPSVVVIAPVDGSKTSATSTNISFSVDGSSSVPTGTSCQIGGQQTTSATSNPVALVLGENTFTVSCSSVFGSGSATVSVTQKPGPQVLITAPGDSETTAASVNVSFTVDGAAEIPTGTTCSVEGEQTSSATDNVVELALGVNAITVGCVDALGSDERTVSIERGEATQLSIGSPADGFKTADSSVEVSFSASGTPTPVCQVDGVVASSPATVAFNPATETATITVSCSNKFGADARSITVIRGHAPQVMINHSLHTTTAAASANATYFVDGQPSIPPETTCSINGAPSTSATGNTVHFIPGENSVTVSCENPFGSGSATVYVFYAPPIQPDPPPETTPPAETAPDPAPAPAPKLAKKLTLKLGSSKQLKPAKKGGIFAKRGGLPLVIKLDRAAKVRVQIERFGNGKKAKKAKRVGVGSSSLKAGRSTLRLSGRIGKKRLAPGRYRVTVSVPGTKLLVRSKAFRVRR